MRSSRGLVSFVSEWAARAIQSFIAVVGLSEMAP